VRETGLEIILRYFITHLYGYVGKGTDRSLDRYFHIARIGCRRQIQAAQIDGASKVQQFWYITVPHIKVVVGLLVVLRTIWVFNNFDIIYLLTGGGPANATTTMPIYAYNMGWNTKLLGRSSAVTMLLLAFLLLVCVIYFTIIGKWEKEDK